MSGQTLTVGGLIFRDGTPEKIQLHVLDELATAIEVDPSDIKYDGDSGKWEFQSVNWASGVEAIGIKTFLEQWKGNIKRFVCSLHHLDDPEEINYRNEPRKKED